MPKRSHASRSTPAAGGHSASSATGHPAASSTRMSGRPAEPCTAPVSSARAVQLFGRSPCSTSASAAFTVGSSTLGMSERYAGVALRGSAPVRRRR